VFVCTCNLSLVSYKQLALTKTIITIDFPRFSHIVFGILLFSGCPEIFFSMFMVLFYFKRVLPLALPYRCQTTCAALYMQHMQYTPSKHNREYINP